MRTLLLTGLAGLATLAPSTAAAPVAQAAGDKVTLDLVRRGRALLEEGKPDEALPLFEQADARAKSAIEVRIWILRAMMDQGRFNDAFDELDRLANKGGKGPAIDYAYGYGSYVRALDAVAQQAWNTAAFAWQDAVAYLASAVAGDPQTYYDAWLPLARACRETQDAKHLEQAAAAADKAVEVAPRNAAARYEQGRIAFWQFTQANAAEAGSDAAQAHLERALASYARAEELLSDANESAPQHAEYLLQLAVAQLWKGDTAAAARAYAGVMEWNPGAVDYATLWKSLVTEEAGVAPFVDCLVAGLAAFEKRWGAATNYDALLQWWLGTACLQQGGELAAKKDVAGSRAAYSRADESFGKAVAKWRAYADSYWYQGLARYHLADYAGAAASWRTHWERDPDHLVQMVQANRDFHLSILDYVVGMLAEAGPEKLVDAAFVCELRTAVYPENWSYWDNYGLFQRDAGAYLSRTGKDGDAERAQALWEGAWAAYTKARELSPEHPHLVNDAAVILDYYLHRDYDKALAMYEQAARQAEELLASGALSAEDKALAETALRDARNNKRRLERKLRGEDDGGEDDGDGDDGDGGGGR
jgi:hypothetical protein